MNEPKKRGRPRKNPDKIVDKNDPLNYVGVDGNGKPYKFMEEDGYLNNVYTKLHSKPRKYPFGDKWKDLKGVSYHRTKWVPADRVRDDVKSRRRLERDPNHPIWKPENGLLRWWHIRINLLGSDLEGRQMIMIRLGASEPIHIRFGTRIEVFYKGKRVNLEED